MLDTKLKPLMRDLTFWIMAAMSLPGIVAVYAAAIDGVTTGSFDPGAFQSAFLALPLVGYLLAREYPRGKAVEAAPAALVASAQVAPMPGADELLDEPEDGFGAVSEGGAHDAVNVDAERTDAAAVETQDGAA